MVVMGNVLIDAGFELAFVAGMLGNIQHEGESGQFESTNYSSNPDLYKPYMKYIDTNFNYRATFSGQNIQQVGITDTKELINKCAAVSYEGKFGLGCVQWTGDRCMDLVDCYISECELVIFPSKEQCYRAESTLIVKELKPNGIKDFVYPEWKADYSDKANAAYEAGSIICIKYEAPDDRFNKAIERGNSAQDIYAVLIGK